MSTSFDDVTGMGNPARGALRAAGYDDVESLAGVDYAELAALHGVGPRALDRLQEALQAQGKTMGGTVPAPKKLGATVTKGHTGKNAADIKTAPTDVAPSEWIAELPWPKRREHGALLLELFNRATGETPVMWGPSMVGYGAVHYASHTGREGDWFQTGFSPRKANLALYGLQGHPRSEELLAALGKHKVGAGCVWINKPEDVDLGVLEELVRHAAQS